MSNQKPNHSRFGGSSAHRWMNCPYSARAEFQREDKGGPAAKRGTDIHNAAEDLWHGRASKLADVDLRTAAEYVAFLRDLVHGPDPKLEFKVSAPSIHDEAFGTIDYVDYHNGILTIVDLKTGKSRVEARDNKQLLYYAIATEDTLDIKPNEYRFYIFQNGEARVWIPDPVIVVEARFAMRDAAARCEVADPVVGEWCQYCKVTECPAKQAVADSMKCLTSW